MRVVQTIVFGLVTGSFLIVATLGFALVSRVNGFLNIAHAEFISEGAFITYFLQARLHWNIVPAALMSVVAVSGIALVLYRAFYEPVLRAGAVTLLITSVGVVYVMHGLTEAVISPGIYGLSLPNYRPFDLGLFRVSVYDLTVMGLAALSVLALHLILTRSAAGLQIRAMADNPDLAASRGIAVRRVSVYVWLLAGALGGIAGVLLALQSALTTDLAFEQILLIISVSILAGLGSILGVVAAGLILAIAMNLSTLVIPTGYQDAVAFAAVIVVLLIRPGGLSGLRLGRRQA